MLALRRRVCARTLVWVHAYANSAAVARSEEPLPTSAGHVLLDDKAAQELAFVIAFPLQTLRAWRQWDDPGPLSRAEPRHVEELMRGSRAREQVSVAQWKTEHLTEYLTEKLKAD